MKPLKCVVWDLDNTLWRGTLLEGGAEGLGEGVESAIRAFDEVGILQSVASRNEHIHAVRQLQAFGIAEYFLHPQIGWNSKSASVRAIAAALNIDVDSIAFIDDDPFERDEVRFAHPLVRCFAPEDLPALCELAGVGRPSTEDARRRRAMYIEDEKRAIDEASTRSQEEFLLSLQLKFTVGRASADDLARVEELTLRTNQLNSTGVTFDRADLERLIDDPAHDLLVCELTDRYGSYGKIGLCLLSHDPAAINIRLLLMSCRVMNRGVGSTLLAHIVNIATTSGKRLTADFRRTDRNRMMYMTYRFMGFEDADPQAEIRRLSYAGTEPLAFPHYVEVNGAAARPAVEVAAR